MKREKLFFFLTQDDLIRKLRVTISVIYNKLISRLDHCVWLSWHFGEENGIERTVSLWTDMNWRKRELILLFLRIKIVILVTESHRNQLNVSPMVWDISSSVHLAMWTL